MMKLRNPLFAPADAERKVANACASSADVAPAAKDTTRATTAKLLVSRPFQPGIIVRVNPGHTIWYLRDLAAVVPGRPSAIMLPKCAGPADLHALDNMKRSKWHAACMSAKSACSLS
jgi:citrate lyase subunit beta/citryl-CoA lyase